MSERYEELIFGEAKRAISVQVAALDELRSRTGLLLAAASLSGSFLGGAAASTSTDLGFVGGLAIFFFVAAVGACIKVLWPKNEGWTFVNSPRDLIADWIEIQRPDESMQLFLADKMEGHFRNNKERIDSLYRWFQLAAVSVGSSVILGCIQLAMSQ